jgi:hypothetical protein
MRNSAQIARFALLALIAFGPARAADFKLGSIVRPPQKAAPAVPGRLGPRPSTPTVPMLAIDIVATGTPSDAAALQDAMKWTLSAATDKVIHPVAVGEVRWDSSVDRVTLIFPATEIAGIDPEKATWTATFNSIPPQTATWSPAKKKAEFAAAKSKDDADLYLFGSFLAGYSTKPLFVIDAKGNWMWPRENWSFGINSAISTNTSAQTPVDRTRIDPDSITGAFSIQRRIDWHAPGIEGIDLNLQPLQGEFSRKTSSSDLVGSALAKLVTKPHKVFGKKHWIAAYPSAGYEAGHNLNQPSVLLKQPVNLSGWNAISRAVVGINGEFYWLSKKPTADDTWRFTIDASYQDRFLFTTEPFITVADIKAMPVYSIVLNRNPRPEAEAHITWNISSYFGLQVQYKYGSLPPLFEFVDHQATIGLTLKAKHAQ